MPDRRGPAVRSLPSDRKERRLLTVNEEEGRVPRHSSSLSPTDIGARKVGSSIPGKTRPGMVR